MAKLYFYFSAMNAGKTTTLLQSAYNYRERGMNALLFTPLIDDRYAPGSICSRIGLHSKAIPFDRNFNFFDSVQKQHTMQKAHCVLIDEAQFLTKKQVFQCTQIADCIKIPVLAYGLRTDFKGEPFEGSQYLLSWAEEICEIKTICHCGSKATMNIRMNAEGNQILTGDQVEIGGNDRYVAVCRKHFYQGKTHTHAAL